MTNRVYYYEDDNLKVRESLARYRFAHPFAQGKRVLDIGCGARRGPRGVAEYAAGVVALDISEEAVLYCAKRWPAPKIDYLAADAVFLPFSDASFDLVLSFETVEHLSKQDGFLKEACRVLRGGGIFIVSTPNKGVMSPGGIFTNPDHVREFSPGELRAFLASRFKDVSLYGQTVSERVNKVRRARKESYDVVRRLPVFLRHLAPRALRSGLFRRYANIFSKARSHLDEYDIQEGDFPIKDGVLESACYLLAVCRK